jgi:hypothetical protein
LALLELDATALGASGSTSAATKVAAALSAGTLGTATPATVCAPLAIQANKQNPAKLPAMNLRSFGCFDLKLKLDS